MFCKFYFLIFLENLWQKRLLTILSLILLKCNAFSIILKHVFVKHGCPPAATESNYGKNLQVLYFDPTPSPGVLDVSECAEPIDELTVQVWILYYHSNFKFCTVSGTELRPGRQTDGQAKGRTIRLLDAPGGPFRLGGIKNLTNALRNVCLCLFTWTKHQRWFYLCKCCRNNSTTGVFWQNCSKLILFQMTFPINMINSWLGHLRGHTARAKFSSPVFTFF